MSSACQTIAVDVGNSAVKVAVQRCESQGDDAGLAYKSFLLVESDWMEGVCRWVDENLLRSEADRESVSCHWWVSTVNRRVSEPLQKHVQRYFTDGRHTDGRETVRRRTLRWKTVQSRDVPLATSVSFPERLGMDRLIGGYAALENHPPPIVVVDAGSAVTIDLVRSDSAGEADFVGGAILPGLRLQLNALAAGTEAIQPIDFSSRDRPPSAPEEQRFVPGKETESAIRLGVVAGVVGGIERLVADYLADTATSSPRVVLTGGDSPLLSRHLRVPHTLVPDLVCRGLIRIANLTSHSDQQ